MRLKTLLMVVLAGSAVAGAAWAWGATGHRLIGQEAMRALPDYVPDFMKTDDAIAAVGEYAREPDRWRKAGDVHDSERDNAHQIDLDDDGNTLAGVSLDNLPPTRDAYDALLVAKNVDPRSWGYLPYSEVDAYQQLVKDMAYWRVESLLETRETDKTKKAWYHADRLRREDLTLRDIGILGHYVGDATQPLHISIHYNGWGNYPNPQGFTMDKIHHDVEGPFVLTNVTAEAVRAKIGAYVPCTDPVMTCFTTRLKKTFALVTPMYQLQKDGGFTNNDPRGVAFVTQQVGQGAQDLRDTILDAWRDSKTMGVGWNNTPYDDFVGNKVADPWSLIYGDD